MFLKQSHFSGSTFSTSANLSATHFKHNARPQGKLRASSELEHGRADSFCVLKHSESLPPTPQNHRGF